MTADGVGEITLAFEIDADDQALLVTFPGDPPRRNDNIATLFAGGKEYIMVNGGETVEAPVPTDFGVADIGHDPESADVFSLPGGVANTSGLFCIPVSREEVTATVCAPLGFSSGGA